MKRLFPRGACKHAPYILALALALSLAGPVLAVQPDEVLPDPALEARARALSRELRCPVCQSESIDDSNAGIARDLRLFLRERLAAGDTDEQAVAAIVARYGEYVLLRPTAGGANLVLWLAGPLLLLVGGAGVALWLRRRGARPGPEALSEDEERRLAEILKE